MKKIDTLVADIYALLDEAYDHGEAEGIASAVEGIGASFRRALSSRTKEREPGKLWASEVGDECLRRLWYKHHQPEDGEKLEPYTRFKFLYGDILEEAVLMLAKEAGHTVEGMQERVEMESPDGTKLISGRKDAKIDGHNVDVKTMSSFAFNKYKTQGGFVAANDSFGYRWQLAFYHHMDPDPDKGAPYILGIDKQNGHIALFPIFDLPTKEELTDRVSVYYSALSDGEAWLPDRAFSPVPDGKSGNMKLPVSCSYCAFKWNCWPTLRGFAYSNGPRYLTTVAREPKAPEIKDDS